MKQLFLNRLIGTGHTRKLCKPLGYFSKQEILYANPVTGEGITISIRPFCVNTDFEMVQDWMCRAYSLDDQQDVKTVGQLVETYTMMLQSDFAQPFIVLLNDTPVFLAEVYYGPYHELALYTSVKEGDYIMELLSGTLSKKMQQVLPQLLQTCLDYFFQFEEVVRVISQPPVGDKHFTTAMATAGFAFMTRLEMAYKTALLYEYNRNRLKPE